VKFLVTSINFDFIDGDFEMPPSMQQEITQSTIGSVWIADDEDDLIEEITCATGWCINSIDYEHVLK
jgi:hypothetical protein